MAQDQKFTIQADQYHFPYHHLLDTSPFNNHKTLNWAFEYNVYLQVVLSIIKSTSFTTLLDVGCGDGKLLFEIQKIAPSKKLKGIDLSHQAILFAQAFNAQNNASFSVTDLADIPETYDIVTLIEVLEHIPDVDMPLFSENIRRVISSSGTLIITVPTKNFPLIKKHYRHYDIESLLSQLPDFELTSHRYVVKHNLFYKIMLRCFSKLSPFTTIRNLLVWLCQRYLNAADKTNGRHLIAVLKPKT